MTERELHGATFKIKATPTAIGSCKRANREARRRKLKAMRRHVLAGARAAVIGWRGLTPNALAGLTPGFTTPQVLAMMEFKCSRAEVSEFEFSTSERDELVAHSPDLFEAVIDVLSGSLDADVLEHMRSRIAWVRSGNEVIGAKRAQAEKLGTH